ncbi:MAG: autotransporter-associated beta strand repeat-containing protein [Pirellulales bacterium]
MTLAGDNSGLTSTSAARIDDGVVILDFANNLASKFRAGTTIDLRGATISMTGNATQAATQSIGGLSLANGGASVIEVSGNGFATTFNLGTLTRSNAAADGTLLIKTSNLGVVTTTSANNVATTAGILGGWITIDEGAGVYFARNDGSGKIAAAVTTPEDSVSAWTPYANITDVAGFSGSLYGFAVNSLRFNADAASTITVAHDGQLHIQSGGILMNAGVATGTHSISGGTLNSGNGELIFLLEGTAAFNVSSNIRPTNGVTKTGLATLTLSGQNVYTGPTDIQGGTLIAAGGNAVGDTSALAIATDQASTFQILADETIGNISGGSAAVGYLFGNIDVGSYTLTLNQTGSTTYAGIFSGSGAIVRNGTSGVGNLQLTGGSGASFTGTFTINGGLVYIESAGTMNASAFIVNKGASFLISNNGGTRPARILDTTPITLNSADGSWNGETKVSGLSTRTDQATTTSETFGALIFNSGSSYLRGDVSGGSSGTPASADLIADNFVRNNNATVTARGIAMGSTTASNRNRFRIGTTTNETAFIGTLVGANGAAGTTTISIVPWGLGETTSTALADTNMGNSLMTYVAGAGFRALDLATEYAALASAGTNDNARASLTADANLAGSKSVNALVLHNADTAASTRSVNGGGAGQTLTIRSGTLLFTRDVAGTGSYGINLGGYGGGIVVGGTTAEYVFFVVNPDAAAPTKTLTATINSPLTSAADITKSGRGTLVLNTANTAGGGVHKTTLNEGILQIGDLDHIGGATGGLVFAGGTLLLGSTFDPLTDDLSTRTITYLNGGGTLDTNGKNLTFAGNYGAGDGSFTKAGLGDLTLTAAAAHTGATRISAGRVILAGGDGRLSTGALAVAGTLQLGTAAATANQTVAELSGAGTLVGGAATVSTLTVNQASATTFSGVIGGAGPNENNIALVKSGVGTLTLGGTTNTFTGGITIKGGTLFAGNNANTFGGAGNTITLGDTSGNADASVVFFNTLTFANPINVAAGSTGRFTIYGGLTTGGPTLSGAITLNNNLILSRRNKRHDDRDRRHHRRRQLADRQSFHDDRRHQHLDGRRKPRRFDHQRRLGPERHDDLRQYRLQRHRHRATQRHVCNGVERNEHRLRRRNRGQRRLAQHHRSATSPLATSSVTVAGGATLNLVNTAGQAINLAREL